MPGSTGGLAAIDSAADPVTPRRTLVAAPDKFRGSLSAPQVVAAVRAAAEPLGWEVIGLPMADGGEGMLDAFGGPNRSSTVTGPLGAPVHAAWRLGKDKVAVIESAAASGLSLAGGSLGNNPMAATSRGTGELIVGAVLGGAKRIIVGLGGSAMTDGGRGAVEAVLHGLNGQRPVDRGVELLAACDVETPMEDAARVFGPQKGADAIQVEHLTIRLRQVMAEYVERFGHDLTARGIDLATAAGAGAAGGLGAGLLVLGGTLVPGFPLVADQVGLDAALAAADVVFTGEGALDAESFNGKVVGSVVDAARRHGAPVVVIVGTVRPDAPPASLSTLKLTDLTARFGTDASWTQTARCIGQAVQEQLTTL